MIEVCTYLSLTWHWNGARFRANFLRDFRAVRVLRRPRGFHHVRHRPLSGRGLRALLQTSPRLLNGRPIVFLAVAEGEDRNKREEDRRAKHDDFLKARIISFAAFKALFR